MCNNELYEKFYDDEFYANRDPQEVMSDQDFLDWVAGKDLEP